jgi:hypothetical protein
MQAPAIEEALRERNATRWTIDAEVACYPLQDIELP